MVPARWSAPSPTAPRQTPQTRQIQRAAPVPTRPAPATPAARAAAVPLTVTGPYAPPLVVQSAPTAPGAGPVPVVRPAITPGAPVPSPPPSAPPPVQRDAGGSRTGGSRTGPGRSDSARDPLPHGGGDLDIDDLARRLLDPVARLLRTELRRGRERAGRPFDGRR